MKVEFEFNDGSHLTINDSSDPWEEVQMIEDVGILEIVSAWKDDEPWFGKCTEVQEGEGRL